MNQQPGHLDPSDIRQINEQARLWAEPGESIVPIDVGRIIVEEDAIDALVELTRSLSGGGPTIVVMDHTPMSRGGEDLKAAVRTALARVMPVTVRKLPDKAVAEYHPDREAAGRLAEELRGCAAVVSVGAGSITDLTKYARTLAAAKTGRRLPLVCFPTAASVTAYTSALAILTLDGCKRNFVSTLPEAIVCDLRTLADAPAAMTQAGFADVLARSVAYGDWYLAGQLGMDDRFSRVPTRLLEPAEQAMIDAAEQIAVGGLAGIRILTEALLLAGMAMTVINQTSPVSGWEHAMSHYLDMTAARDGRSTALHGGQVGVGTLISARAYERTWKELDLDRLAAEVDHAEIAACRRTIETLFTPCDRTGRMAAEVCREMEQKLDHWRQCREARRRFAARKRAGELDAPLRALVRSADAIGSALARVGAPQRFADLDRPVSALTGQAAVRFGHLVRSRFTLGDLLDRTGWLTADTAASLLDEPG